MENNQSELQNNQTEKNPFSKKPLKKSPTKRAVGVTQDNHCDEVEAQQNEKSLTPNENIEKSSITKESDFLNQLSFIANNSNGTALNIVNAPTGKRITLSKPIVETLGHPDAVKVAILKKDTVVFQASNLGETNVHPLKGQGKRILYSSSIIKRVTDLWELDFSNCSSQSVGSFDTKIENDETFILVTK